MACPFIHLSIHLSIHPFTHPNPPACIGCLNSVWWLRLHASSVEDRASIPGQETRILHAAPCSQKKIFFSSNKIKLEVPRIQRCLESGPSDRVRHQLTCAEQKPLFSWDFGGPVPQPTCFIAANSTLHLGGWSPWPRLSPVGLSLISSGKDP